MKRLCVVARPDGVEFSVDLHDVQVDGEILRVFQRGDDAFGVVVARVEHAHILPFTERVGALGTQNAAALRIVMSAEFRGGPACGVVDIPAAVDVVQFGSPVVGDIPRLVSFRIPGSGENLLRTCQFGEFFRSG